MSVAFAALTYVVPVQTASNGTALSSGEWNKIVTNLTTLDSKVASALRPPVSVCRPSANQNLVANTWQQIVFDQRKYDTDSFCDTTGSTKFLPTKAGYYRVTVTAGYTKSAGGGGYTSYLSIKKNTSATELATYALHNYTSSHQHTMTASTISYLNGTTDYLTAEIFVNDANGTTTIQGGDNTHFVAEWIRE
ncbi:MAG: hypothetical protein QMC36_04705 [Patescibacteria group bacterium]